MLGKEAKEGRRKRESPARAAAAAAAAGRDWRRRSEDRRRRRLPKTSSAAAKDAEDADGLQARLASISRELYLPVPLHARLFCRTRLKGTIAWNARMEGSAGTLASVGK